VKGAVEMGVALPSDLKSALMDPRSIKILSTVNRNGDTHLSFKHSVRLREDSNLEYDEIHDNSENNRNMHYAVWTDKVFLLNVHTWDRRAFKMAVKPKKAIINGEEFKIHCEAFMDNGRAYFVSTVWVLEPLSFIETTPFMSKPDKSGQETILFSPEQLRP
jgi:hypothetical protein